MEEQECCKGCKWYQETTYEDDTVSRLECQHPLIDDANCLDEARPNIKGKHWEKKEDGSPPTDKSVGIRA